MEIELNVSQDLVNKLVSSGVLEIDEMNDPEKIADAIEGAIWNLPDDISRSIEVVALKIEQHIYEAGAYDFSDSESSRHFLHPPVWVDAENGREATRENLFNVLRNGEMGGHDALMDYLHQEINQMIVTRESEEAIASMKAIVQQLEDIPAVYKDEVIEEWGKQALLDCNFGDTSIQILSAGYDDYIRTETIKAAFQDYCENNDGHTSFSDYFTAKMDEEYFSEIGTDLVYELWESIKEKASERSEDFLAALELYKGDLPPSEVLEAFGYEGYEFELVDFLRNNYRLNLMMATENELNFDSCGLMQCYGDIPSTAKLSEEDFGKYADNALSYLIQQQGHTVEEAMSVMQGTERTNNEFINSVRDEVESHSYDMGLLTVCVSARGQELLDVLDTITSKEQSLKFSEQTNLCIHDKWNGSTSAIDITLERNAVFPASMVHEVQFEGSGRDDLVAQESHNWTVNDVCGLVGSVWTDGSVSVTKDEPVLMQENLTETHKLVADKVATMEKSDKHKEITDD